MKKMKCIKFPKIYQFRNVVSSINRHSSFVGLDDNGEAIYDYTLPKPVVRFKGLVKLHGTNAGVSYTDTLGMWVQSRGRSYGLDKHDAHMGFVFFVNTRKELFEGFMKKIALENDIDTSVYCITIYGEWVGKGIQKSVSISELEKSFFIFGIKVSKPEDEEFNSYWLEFDNIRSNEDRVYNLLDFNTYDIEIDFNKPELSQNTLGNITQEIEDECPVAKEFGHSGVGEGVVWVGEYKGSRYVFKVKGEKHSNTKVKTLAPVDIEKVESIDKFVDYSVTRNRFEQGMREIFPTEHDYTTQKTGDIIRWVINDIMDEEMDVMVENNLTPKDVNKHISNKVRKMFFKELGL